MVSKILSILVLFFHFPVSLFPVSLFPVSLFPVSLFPISLIIQVVFFFNRTFDKEVKLYFSGLPYQLLEIGCTELLGFEFELQTLAVVTRTLLH